MRATVIAVAALFFAAAGGSYAAGILVGSAQIKDHSIRPVDLAPSVTTALKYDPSKLTTVIGFVDVQPNTVGTASAACPSGSVAVSGGGFAVTGLNTSEPVIPTGQSAPSGWMVQTFNYLSQPAKLTAMAVCS
jgi:hypothetical protein